MLRREVPKLAALKLLLEVGLERLAVCEGGVVLESNEAFAFYLGYETAELRGRPLSTLVGFDTEDARVTPSENSPELREATAMLRGGKHVAVEVATRVLDIGGRKLELVALRDLSVLLSVQNALRRYQAELERKNRDLERANRIQSEFLATISHELRTPLTSVIGYAQLLGDVTHLSDDQRDYVSQIQASGLQLVSLIDGLIDLSRLESGNISLERERVPFMPLLGRVLSRVRGDAEAKGQTINVTGETEALIYADPYRLEQILGAFLSNAVKFTPLGGQIEVRVLGGSGELRCEVADTGIGVAPEDVPHIFQPFFQVSTLKGRSHNGAGLGLALAKHLTELHGGRVWVESEPGQGSRFGFSLGQDPAQRSEPLPSYSDVLRPEPS